MTAHGWMSAVVLCLVSAFGTAWAAETGRSPLVLTDRLHHLRIDGPREWSEFPETPESDHLEWTFSATPNEAEATLLLRQQDVKQGWRVRLNDRDLGRLVVDENDQWIGLSIPAGALVAKENRLRIEPVPGSRQSDDIRVGMVRIDSRPRRDVFSEANLEVDVIDAGTAKPIPARITIVRAEGGLQTTGAASTERLAVRPGLVYTADGSASIGLPAGRYVLHAGHGFEYSVDTAELDLKPGDSVKKSLTIRREVPTEGWIACDTHVHTVTFSGHGDATIEERMISLAAEGIELPIATDHNRQVDYEAFARRIGVRRYFTPVVGNEVTTKIGHFNVFPILPDATAPDDKASDWETLFRSIHSTPDAKVVVLNHARDLHSGVRPFGPKWQNRATGENLQGWQLRANAMEVFNSGSVQSQPLLLFQDWMEQLNRGRMLTPIGGSDSHDVARHFVGQARTYIRGDDSNPGELSVDETIRNLIAGRVMVSYGLLAELTVEGRYGPGELVPVVADSVRVNVRVLGPSWSKAGKVLLFANGQLFREQAIGDGASRPGKTGVLWEGGWTIPRPGHDVHLVAIAVGPGVEGLYWRTAKPYQPTSPDWTPTTLGASGAVWLDVDGDGRPTPAIDYARRIRGSGAVTLATILEQLADYDSAVAAHAAALWQPDGGWDSEAARAALRQAAPATRQGIQNYLNAVRESTTAQIETP